MKQFIAAAAFGAVSLSSTAYANDGSVPQGTFSISDLDLSTEAGVKELDARIDRTARMICKINEPVTGSLLIPKDRRECYANAKKSVKSQVAFHIKNARHGG